MRPTRASCLAQRAALDDHPQPLEALGGDCRVDELVGQFAASVPGRGEKTNV